METNESVKTALWQEAEAELHELVKRLGQVEKGDMKGLEEQLVERVFALGRKWMGKILSSREASERSATWREGECGHRQRLVGQRPKQLLTLLGKVRFSRPYYQCQPERAEEGSCTHGEAPADRVWGVQGQRTTSGVQQAVSYLAALGTLQEASEAFSRLLPLEMSARQVLTLMQPVGEALLAQETAQVKGLWQQAAEARTSASGERPVNEKGGKRLYIELDGVTARLRRGSVPMEEKEQQRPSDVYREVKVGAVFEASRGRERSELVPGVFVDQAEEISYVARRTTAEEFGPLLYALAVQKGMTEAKEVVVLGDGALWIWRLAQEQFPKAVQIVDLWHAKEHVWKVARAVFGSSSPLATAWANSAVDLLVQGQIEALGSTIAALPPIAPEAGASRSVPEIERDYFLSNATRMRYPVFRAHGMHLGSGIAEAACKTVVSTRAKRSGMRWTPRGLDAVLALRTSVLNRSYDSFWQHRSHLVA